MFELQKNFGEPIGENFLEASRQFVFVIPIINN